MGNQSKAVGISLCDPWVSFYNEYFSKEIYGIHLAIFASSDFTEWRLEKCQNTIPDLLITQ